MEIPEHLKELLEFEFKEKPQYNLKQYILIRTDRAFSLGKLLVHAAHNACSALLFEWQKKGLEWTSPENFRIRQWFNSGKCQAKIVCSVADEMELKWWIKVVNKYAPDVPMAIIPDGGAYQVESHTIIGCAIGPVSPDEAEVLGLNKLPLY